MRYKIIYYFLNGIVDKCCRMQYYNDVKILKEIWKMKIKHICQLCGYEYDPRGGDAEEGIAPGTDFEDIPADWVCPLCGAGKDDFECVTVDDDEE